MKKIFTFFALSIMAMSVMAAETVLWEGSWYVSWDLPDGDDHKEWKHLGQTDFASYAEGTTVCFYLEQTADATYAKYELHNWSWALLPGQTPTDFSGATVAKLPMNAEVKAAIAEGGFAIHGHGFNVVKATLTDEAGEDPQEPQEPQGDVLWEGDHFVSWHYKESDTEHAANREWKFLNQATFAGLEVGTTLYFLFAANPISIEGCDPYSAYKFDNSSWETLPGTPGQVDITSDTVATLVVSEELKAHIAAKGFAIHGHGFNFKKVSLSPIEIPETEEPEEPGTETAVDNTTIPTNASRYNLIGQKVDENYKGVIILNGRKMIVR